MAVLVEARSVIIRRDAIDWGLSGGWDAFLRLVPNRNLCTDGRLARVGFMHPAELREFLDKLTERGLVVARKGRSEDAAVVDQACELTLPCDWLQLGRVAHRNGTQVGYCQLTEPGSAPTPIESFEEVAVHEGWTPDFTRGMDLQPARPRGVPERGLGL